jgi:hypothetical protein
MEDWGFIWLMVVLKIPIIALCLLVWWAVRQEPLVDEDTSGDDGGTKHRPRWRRPFGKGPRRGPHGEPALPAPPRVRTTAAARQRAGRH